MVITRLCPGARSPSFLTSLAQQDGVAALALRFVVLTAARTSEALNARSV